MRIGLLADIHGNLDALDAVLDDLATARLDQLICLGDLAVLGPQPAAVIARLRSLGCPGVLGNTDAWLLGTAASDSARLREITRWAAGQLTAADWRYLRSCPLTLEREIDGQRLLCYHGSPRSFDEVIAATTPASDLATIFADRPATLLIGGHTHLQLLRRWGDAALINPGSIGLPGTGPGTPDLPVNRDVAWGEYAVLDLMEDRVRVEFRRAPLSLSRLLTTLRESGMPHAAWWAALWRDNLAKG